MTNEILVGVDAAWRRSGALDWALHEAVLRRIPLRAVHVIDDRVRRAYAAPGGVDGQTGTASDGRLIDDLEEYVAAVDPTVELGTDVLIGAPDRTLTEQSVEAELTVVGRRGLGGFARTLIGSTSEFVVDHAPGPVVVVPSGWRWDRFAHAPIVVGVDADERNDPALEFAFETAGIHRVPLWLVHAWEVPTPYSWDATAISDEHTHWKQLAQQRLDKAADQWERKYPEVHRHDRLPETHPVVGLLDTAESTGAQLIVVGGHRHTRMSGLLLGSVARGVLREAAVPVAVVHHRGIGG